MSKKGLKDILPRENQNRELWTRTEQECISAEIARRKWNWIGHTWQKSTSDSTRQALEWNPHEKKEGRKTNENLEEVSERGTQRSQHHLVYGKKNSHKQSPLAPNY